MDYFTSVISAVRLYVMKLILRLYAYRCQIDPNDRTFVSPAFNNMICSECNEKTVESTRVHRASCTSRNIGATVLLDIYRCIRTRERWTYIYISTFLNLNTSTPSFYGALALSLSRDRASKPFYFVYVIDRPRHDSTVDSLTTYSSIYYL